MSGFANKNLKFWLCALQGCVLKRKFGGPIRRNSIETLLNTSTVRAKTTITFELLLFDKLGRVTAPKFERGAIVGSNPEACQGTEVHNNEILPYCSLVRLHPQRQRQFDPLKWIYQTSSKFDQNGVKWVESISPNLHFVKRRDEQNVNRTPIVDQDSLYIEIGDRSEDNQRIIMGEVQAYQIIIGEVCLFRYELEHPLDPNPPWVAPDVGLLLPYLPLGALRGGRIRCEAFFCLTLQLMKLAIKSLLRSSNESMVLEDNFLNHDLAVPFKVVEKALYITSSDWDDNLNLEETLTLITLFVNGGSICLIKASTVAGACANVDGINPGVQAFKVRSLAGVCHRMGPVAQRDAGTRSRREQPIVNIALDLSINLGSNLGSDLHKGTNIIGWDEAASNPFGMEIRPRKARLNREGRATFYRWRRKSRVRRSQRNSQVAKYGRRSHGYKRRIRRMPYGGGTVNVRIWEELESHIDLILRVPSEVAHLALRRGDDVRRSDHLGSLGELITNHGSCW
ncbi:hypothetical protein Acr_09g0002540 [Actinidia rufa]|uniref:Uncharacterized protein n=1 Tax=Actinidia rufa TaxID=165716 RepID=A0A7J0F525_9ERIC|nr:hypothetical protein Acr_09g0002540 [Actinidia rufa]